MQTRVAGRLLMSLGGAVLAMALLAGCSGGGDGDQAIGTADQVAAAAPADSRAAPADATTDAAATTGGGHAHVDGGALALAMAAVDAVDSAGFHDMQQELEGGGAVNERWAGTVGNALVALRIAPWDEELGHGVGELSAALEGFQQAIESGDAAAALAAAVAVHEAQHHFSPNVYAWLGEQNVGHDEGSVLATSLAAIDIIDSSGFHGMGEAIREANEVSSRYQGKVNNALAVLKAASWPEGQKAAVDAQQAALELTAAQMDAQDIEGTLAGLEAIHEAQHELSHGYYAWLAANHEAIDHSDEDVALACALKSVDMVNAVGLHGMAEDLESAGEINDRYAGQIARMVAVFAGAPHHGEAAMASEQMHEQLISFGAALDADDLEAARESALAAHEAQHGLSHDTFAWLAQSATMVQMGSDGHGHGEAADAASLEDASKDRVIELEMDNFLFRPDAIEIGAGEVVELHVANVVDVPHDFTIDRIDADVHISAMAGTGEHAHVEGMEEADLHFALTERGEGLVHVKVHEPGEYVFWCTVPGHRELGMVGTLIVR